MKRDYNVSRAQMENAEGLDQSTNKQAPAARFQQSQQVNKADVALDAKAPDTSFTAKKVNTKGSVLKQEAVASVLTGEGDYAGGPVSTGTSANSAAKAGLKTLSYSGDAGTILGNTSATPVLSQADRGKGRFDKKLDAVNKKINYLASEQFLIEYDQPAPLANNDSVQGYNGTPKNSTARLQKKSGGSPAELLFDRSVDEIFRDEILFSTGQIVRQTGTVYQDGLSKIPVENADHTLQYDDEGHLVLQDNPASRCNGVNEYLKVTFSRKNDSERFLSGFEPLSYSSEDEFTEDVVNAANTNVLIDMNEAEIARQAIDSKAGRESQPDWSPLGRAVYNPTGIVGYLRDMETITGSEIFAAYHFATKAFAYQLNKASKDGQLIHRPMREMFMANIDRLTESGDESASPNIFNVEDYLKGSAAIMIDLFDSKAKYSTKADILTQPRGLRMHFQTADNNINVFRVKPEFVSALNSRDVFSTIDREYDPLMPVCVADDFTIVHPYKFSDLLSFTRANATSERVYSSKLVQYAYADRNSDYRIKVANPLLAGVAYFFEQHADKITRILDVANNDSKTMYIPIKHSTTTFSLWDWLILASVPYIQYERTNAMKDVLDYEVNFEYPFKQLSTIGDMNPVSAVNYTIKDKDSPLIAGRMLPSVALSWIMPEVFMSIRDTNLKLLPWYFNEDQFDFLEAGGKSYAQQKAWSGVMSFPVIRSGARLSYLDMFYGMSERDIRLCLDRLTVVPGVYNSATEGYVYKYSQSADGIPVVDMASVMDVAKYISCPRELGWFMVSPLKSNNSTTETPRFAVASTSYRLRSYYGAFGEQADFHPLGAASVSVNRGQNFAQNWKMLYAVQGYANPDIGMSIYPCDGLNFKRFDGILETDGYGLCCDDTAATDNRPKSRQFAIPFTKGVRNAGSLSQVVVDDPDMALYNAGLGLWAMLQKLPFIINPFQVALCNFEDPFDQAYLFNFAGFMASDYNEDVFNRINEVQNKGWLYTADPFVTASPVFKDAAKHTQIA